MTERPAETLCHRLDGAEVQVLINYAEALVHTSSNVLTVLRSRSVSISDVSHALTLVEDRLSEARERFNELAQQRNQIEGME